MIIERILEGGFYHLDGGLFNHLNQYDKRIKVDFT